MSSGTPIFLSLIFILLWSLVYILYRLKIVQPHRTSDVLTRAKVVYYGSVLNAQPIFISMTREDMIRFIYPQVKLLHEPDTGSTSMLHFRVFKTCRRHFHLEPPRGTTYQRHCFNHKAIHSTMFDLSQLTLCEADMTSLPLEYPFSSRGVDFLLLEEGKPVWFILSHVAFILLPFAQESYPGVWRCLVYLYSTPWNLGPRRSKPLRNKVPLQKHLRHIASNLFISIV